MKAESRNPCMIPVGSEPERILWNLSVVSAESTRLIDADVLTQFVRAQPADDLWRKELAVLPKQAVHHYREDESYSEGINEAEPMQKKFKHQVCL